MADLLTIGASSLLNLQHALNTTGHNIANVNTEGYSRQSVNFGARDYQSFGFGFVGQGAGVTNVTRAANDFIISQLQGFTSSQSRFDTQASFLSRLDNILADADNSLNGSLQNFFNSVQEVATNPAGLPERQLLLADARNLVSRQQNLQQMFNSLNGEVNSELRAVVSDINRLVDNIALMNREIVSAKSSANGAAPNDLLDKRDLLVRDLAQRVSVTAVPQDDGAVNIFVGRGQALVVGTETTHLQTQNNPYDSSRLEIALAGQSAGNSISQFLGGGQLQGLLDFRRDNLAAAQAQAGVVMLALTAAFNEQHTHGLDLNGDQGGDFFKPLTLSAAAHSGNAGSATPAITISDAAAVRASEYRLSYQGPQWTLTRTSDNTAVTGTGPLVLDGLSVDVSAGTPASGDSFILNPGRDAAAGFALALQDARQFAAASAVSLHSAPGNSGTAVLENLHVTAASLLPLAAPLVLSFSADALGPGLPGFLINGGADGTLAYDPATEGSGKDFTLAGFGLGFRIEGNPGSGATFTLADNGGARGDSGNALDLAALQQRALVNGSAATFQEYYTGLVAEVGIHSRQATANLEVETSMLEQAAAYRDGISGVNLDEEASNMLRFQQSYQAAAQVVKMADELFQVLLDSIR